MPIKIKAVRRGVNRRPMRHAAAPASSTIRMPRPQGEEAGTDGGHLGHPVPVVVPDGEGDESGQHQGRGGTHTMGGASQQGGDADPQEGPIAWTS